MDEPEPLIAFARGLHQDVLEGLTREHDLARVLLAGLTPAEKEALRAWLPKALETLTPAEMKGVLKRASTDISFSSKGAQGLLRAAADELELP
jgi:hypothetical protein